MRKPLIVGQAPSKDTDGRPPFSGRSGKRLAELLGVPHECLGELFDLANLVPTFPGKQGKGDAFPMDVARANAARLNPWGRPFVLLVGKQVAQACGFKHASYFDLLFMNNVSTFIVPHPSGVNRWWNDPANREKAEAFMRALPALRTAAPGSASREG